MKIKINIQGLFTLKQFMKFAKNMATINRIRRIKLCRKVVYQVIRIRKRN